MYDIAETRRNLENDYILGYGSDKHPNVLFYDKRPINIVDTWVTARLECTTDGVMKFMVCFDGAYTTTVINMHSYYCDEERSVFVWNITGGHLGPLDGDDFWFTGWTPGEYENIRDDAVTVLLIMMSSLNPKIDKTQVELVTLNCSVMNDLRLKYGARCRYVTELGLTHSLPGDIKGIITEMLKPNWLELLGGQVHHQYVFSKTRQSVSDRVNQFHTAADWPMFVSDITNDGVIYRF